MPGPGPRYWTRLIELKFDLPRLVRNIPLLLLA